MERRDVTVVLVVALQIKQTYLEAHQWGERATSKRIERLIERDMLAPGDIVTAKVAVAREQG